MSWDRLSSLTLHQLRIFAAVARARSFHHAAEDLDLSQPTVSDQVKLLEHMVGARLFERSSGCRQVEVSQAGRILLRHCEEVFRALDRAASDIQALHSAEGGTIAFGTDVTLLPMRSRLKSRAIGWRRSAEPATGRTLIRSSWPRQRKRN